MTQGFEAMTSNEKEFHRKFAAKCFNDTWNYLDKPARTGKENEEMLHLAHASRYHWGLVGTARNLMVGEWQISRVYANLKQPDLAIMFAESALDLCEKNSLSDSLVTVYEGLARAHAAAQDFTRAKDYITKARFELESVRDKEDRHIYEEQIKETETMILR